VGRALLDLREAYLVGSRSALKAKPHDTESGVGMAREQHIPPGRHMTARAASETYMEDGSRGNLSCVAFGKTEAGKEPCGGRGAPWLGE